MPLPSFPEPEAGSQLFLAGESIELSGRWTGSRTVMVDMGEGEARGGGSQQSKLAFIEV